MLKKILKVAGILLVVVLAGAGGFVALKVNQHNTEMARVWDIPLPTNITRSTDPAVIARGKHLAESVAGCATTDCHGSGFDGGKVLEMGPVGTLQGPNLTAGGIGDQYSDAELARVVIHGVKRDGRSLLFMPSNEFNWLPDDDIAAIISYMRTVPPSSKKTAPPQMGVLGKVLDSLDVFKASIARGIDHQNRKTAPTPTPTAAYGEYIAKGCQGCHGETLAGGPIPGAPPDMAVPRNLTPDATGLKGWTFANFEQVLNTGKRPDGTQLNPFMPYEAYARMNDLEKQALWAYLQTLPPKPFGSR